VQNSRWDGGAQWPKLTGRCATVMGGRDGIRLTGHPIGKVAKRLPLL